jgi:hypothetical protein
VRAVNDWQAESVPGFHRSARFADFDTIEWADFFVVSGRPVENGCSLGSPASEIVKTDLDVHDDLTRVFAEWRDIFRAGLERMQYDGRLDASADPARLAHMLIAAYQGGSLLAQIARDVVRSWWLIGAASL